MGIDEQRLTDAWYRDWRDVFASFNALCLLASSITFPLPHSCSVIFSHRAQIERDHSNGRADRVYPKI